MDSLRYSQCSHTINQSNKRISSANYRALDWILLMADLNVRRLLVDKFSSTHHGSMQNELMQILILKII